MSNQIAETEQHFSPLLLNVGQYGRPLQLFTVSIDADDRHSLLIFAFAYSHGQRKWPTTDDKV